MPRTRDDRPATAYRQSKRFREEAREVGARVRAIRQALGLTLEQAASRMEGDFRHFQRIEAGEANVTLATVLRVAEALQIAPYRLLQAPADQPAGAGSRSALPPAAASSHGTHDNIKYGARQGAPVARSREEPDVLAALGAAVRNARAAAGLTQRALATATGMTVQHVQRIEYGRQNVTVRTLAKIAAALGVPTASLL